MARTRPRTDWGLILALGSLWGLSEAAPGLSLRQCASTAAGPLLTGAALFFLAAGRAVSSRWQAAAAMAGLAAGFKLFDALLPGPPAFPGALGNPVFAIVMEAAAFVLILGLIGESAAGTAAGQGLAGGLAALLAAGLFPLVKYATGVAACVTGAGHPLSLYHAPLAAALSALAVPLGFRAGAGLAALAGRPEVPVDSPALRS